MADFLVTGTDTGIGKTVIAAALVKALRAQGVRAIGFKPVETGVEEGHVADSERLARASAETNPLTAPLLQLAEPLAPAVAAERAGSSIRPQDIEERIELLRRAGYTLVVEGAGGVMVPLAWEKGVGRLFPRDRQKKPPDPFFYTVMDLAEHCGFEAIVVGRAGLGTLNHVAMTVATLRSRNIPVKAVLLNGGDYSKGDVAEATNPTALARMLPGVLIVEVPHHDGPDVIDATVPYLRALFTLPKQPSDRERSRSRRAGS